MTKHEPISFGIEAGPIHKLVDLPHRRDKIVPESVCVFLLLLASIIVGVRAWLQL